MENLGKNGKKIGEINKKDNKKTILTSKDDIWIN